MGSDDKFSDTCDIARCCESNLSKSSLATSVSSWCTGSRSTIDFSKSHDFRMASLDAAPKMLARTLRKIPLAQSLSLTVAACMIVVLLPVEGSGNESCVAGDLQCQGTERWRVEMEP